MEPFGPKRRFIIKNSRYFYIALLTVSIAINHVATICTMGSRPIDDQLMEEVSRKDDHEDVVLVRNLIESGANPNAPDVFLVRPLHMAARYNHGAYVTLLLEKGADPCAKVVNVFAPTRTPLHYAALSKGDSGTKALLADRRTVVDEQDNEGNTALHVAVINGNKAAAIALISAGASVNIANTCEKTPLDLAESEERLSEHDALYTEIANHLRSVGGKSGRELTESYQTHRVPLVLWNYGTSERKIDLMEYSISENGIIKIYRKISRAELNEQWRLPEGEEQDIPESVLPRKLIGEWNADDPYIQEHFIFMPNKDIPNSGWCRAK